MAQATDLYSILRAYATKNNSPYVDIGHFLEFLEKYAGYKAQEQREWIKWTSDVEAKFQNELASLTESEKCVLTTNEAGDRLYMPFFCRDHLGEIYKNIENMAELPFPDEELLKITIPEDQLQVINVGSDIGVFFEESGSAQSPEQEAENAPDSGHIVKIYFPTPYGSALVLASMIPRRLMEIAFLKMRHFLCSRGNKDYVLHKLIPQMQGREKALRDAVEQLIVRPNESFTGIEGLSDFSYIFWNHFCALVRNTIGKKNDLLGEDIAAVQSVYIIEACNGFYRARAMKNREIEIAFRNLEQCMEKSPCYFTLDDIIKFTNEKGVSLLGQYSQNQLEAYIKKRASRGEDSFLPEWIVLQGKKNKRWYIKKSKYLTLCTRLLIDTRTPVKKTITGRWVKLLREFRSEPAMENDAEFEKLLKLYTEHLCPILFSLLENERLIWIYEEQESSQGIPPASRIFKGGRLLPMSALYAISRKDVLTDSKFVLPFWYSVPLFTAIIGFFKNFKKRKKGGRSELNIGINEVFEIADNEMWELQKAARNIGAVLVPKNKTLDTYLEELENRWSKILDKRARQNLIDDVRYLIRDTLRYETKILKTKKISREILRTIAENLITRTPSLLNLGNRNALSLYIELYMLKLLLD
jgi:hypothetical protein